MSIVYLNGEFIPVEQAKVSVLDRGFLFGDGVYEVIPAYGGHLLSLEKHLQRLQNSLNAISLPNPLQHNEWVELLHRLLKENDGEDQTVYLQLTRGVSAVRDHSFPADPIPTVFIMSSPLKAIPGEILKQGVAAITLDDIRWKACNIKATALLANTMLRTQANNAGAAEAILIRDGYVTEGAASNVFIVIDDVLLTPPTSPLLLPGITRDLVLELARENNIACAERDITEDELKSANEIWLTSSTKEIMPVTMLNGQAVGNAHYGPIWDTMIEIYQAFKIKYRTGDI